MINVYWKWNVVVVIATTATFLLQFDIGTNGFIGWQFDVGIRSAFTPLGYRVDGHKIGSVFAVGIG